MAARLTRGLKRSISNFSRTVLFFAFSPCSEVGLGLRCLGSWFALAGDKVSNLPPTKTVEVHLQRKIN